MNEIYLLMRVTRCRDRDNQPVLEETPDLDAGFFTDRAEAERVASERDNDLHVGYEIHNRARRAELARARRHWGQSLREHHALVEAGMHPTGHEEKPEPTEPRQVSFGEYLDQLRTGSTLVTTEVATVSRSAS